MKRPSNKLTDKIIARVKPGVIVAGPRKGQPAKGPIKLFDGEGLHLLMMPDGRSYWRMDYRFPRGGKAQTPLSFGPYPETTIGRAREMREQAQAMLRTKTDPRETFARNKRRTISRSVSAIHNGGKTFSEVADLWYARVSGTWKAKNAARVRSKLNAVCELIGDKPIRDVTHDDLTIVMDKIFADAPMIADKTIQHLRRLFAFAVETTSIDLDVAPSMSADWAKRYAPAAGKKENRVMIPVAELPAFWKKLTAWQSDCRTAAQRERENAAKRALMMTILCATRPDETRSAAAWEFEGDQWTIPGARRKSRTDEGRTLIVPLSRQALALEPAKHCPYKIVREAQTNLLQKIHPETPKIDNGGHVVRDGKGEVLMVAPGAHATARSGFKSWAESEGKWPSNLIEACYGHASKDKVAGSYDHSSADPKVVARRREVLQAWADYVTGGAS